MDISDVLRLYEKNMLFHDGQQGLLIRINVHWRGYNAFKARSHVHDHQANVSVDGRGAKMRYGSYWHL